MSSMNILLFICVFFHSILATTERPIGQCALIKCGKNQICNECGIRCEKKCCQESVICPRICLPHGHALCQCKSNYFRNPSGKCVSEAECRKKVGCPNTTVTPILPGK
ncbi:unnamed protein product, partial [Mesorhabditis belari]|uniref:Trypsin Inhibitor like cysteine rich domain protein n=1 Tax=Mesorhabditis belari TaxID=2138241 RepID=A0AAF3EKM0_9BILA